MVIGLLKDKVDQVMVVINNIISSGSVIIVFNLKTRLFIRR